MSVQVELSNYLEISVGAKIPLGNAGNGYAEVTVDFTPKAIADLLAGQPFKLAIAAKVKASGGDRVEFELNGKGAATFAEPGAFPDLLVAGSIGALGVVQVGNVKKSQGFNATFKWDRNGLQLGAEQVQKIGLTNGTFQAVSGLFCEGNTKTVFVGNPSDVIAAASIGSVYTVSKGQQGSIATNVNGKCGIEFPGSPLTGGVPVVLQVKSEGTQLKLVSDGDNTISVTQFSGYNSKGEPQREVIGKIDIGQILQGLKRNLDELVNRALEVPVIGDVLKVAGVQPIPLTNQNPNPQPVKKYASVPYGRGDSIGIPGKGELIYVGLGPDGRSYVQSTTTRYSVPVEIGLERNAVRKWVIGAVNSGGITTPLYAAPVNPLAHLGNALNNIVTTGAGIGGTVDAVKTTIVAAVQKVEVPPPVKTLFDIVAYGAGFSDKKSPKANPGGFEEGKWIGNGSVGKQVFVQSDKVSGERYVTNSKGDFLRLYSAATTNDMIRETLANPKSNLASQADRLDVAVASGLPQNSILSSIDPAIIGLAPSRQQQNSAPPLVNTLITNTLNSIGLSRDPQVDITPSTSPTRFTSGKWVGNEDAGVQLYVREDLKTHELYVTSNDHGFISRYKAGTTEQQIRETLSNTSSSLRRYGDVLIAVKKDDTFGKTIRGLFNLSNKENQIFASVPQNDVKLGMTSITTADNRILGLKMNGNTPVVYSGDKEIAKLNPTSFMNAKTLLEMPGSPFKGLGIPAEPASVALNNSTQPFKRVLEQPKISMTV